MFDSLFILTLISAFDKNLLLVYYDSCNNNYLFSTIQLDKHSVMVL